MRPTLLALLFFAATAHSQWQLQDAHTTADLRGIDNVGEGVAWASGSNGTVLRTEDAGFVWQLCAIPPGAEHLDFRGIQAFDNNTAIVMSSGKGDLSRLYKTTDGCQTWKLLFTNPDKDGFWDALAAHISSPADRQTCTSATPIIEGAIFGDPTLHSLQQTRSAQPTFYFGTFTANSSCAPDKLNPSLTSILASSGEAAFAASNSILSQLDPHSYLLATSRTMIRYNADLPWPGTSGAPAMLCGADVPLGKSSSSQGVFSFAIRSVPLSEVTSTEEGQRTHCLWRDLVAVGGDYTRPESSVKTAAFTGGTNKFSLAQTPPHGYRSAVAYDPTHNLWITVGPNGTDISTDDGRNWRPLKPNLAAGDTPDADQHWNALSLPYVVGPHGRIATLRPDALPSRGSSPK